MQLMKKFVLASAFAAAMGTSSSSCTTGSDHIVLVQRHASSLTADNAIDGVKTRSENTAITSMNASMWKAGECITLTGRESYYTVDLKLGEKGQSVNAVIDTGSNDIVIDISHESPSMIHSDPPKEEVVGYGSGDATMELVEDVVKVGATVVSNANIKLMKSNNFGFSIEGILPLGPSDQSDWPIDSFSLCFHTNSAGSFVIGDSSASITASGQWEVSLSDISIDGKPSGIKGSGVPDSGTTFLVAPSKEDLANLFVKICTEWSNCKKDSGEQGDSVDDFWASVEKDCGKSAPSISFDFGGTSAAVSASSYVVEDQNGKCVPAFDVDESFRFWILGLPLFMSNQVHFAGKKIGFTPGCGSCGGGLYQHRAEEVWKLNGPPRWPTRSKRNTEKHEFVLGDEETDNPNVVQLVKHLTEHSWASSK